MRTRILDGVVLDVTIDIQDDYELVTKASLIINEYDEIELDLSQYDNQTMISKALINKCLAYNPVFESL